MTERIKLTEENLKIFESEVRCEAEDKLHDEMRKQILDDQKKVEKYNGLTHFSNKQTELINEQVVENKQLKEGQRVRDKNLLKELQENCFLQKKLEKIEILFLKYTNCVMDSLEFNRQLDEILKENNDGTGDDWIVLSGGVIKHKKDYIAVSPHSCDINLDDLEVTTKGKDCKGTDWKVIRRKISPSIKISKILEHVKSLVDFKKEMAEITNDEEKLEWFKQFSKKDDTVHTNDFGDLTNKGKINHED